MKGREWKFQERKRILKSHTKVREKRKKTFENQIESEQCITNEKSL